MKMSFKPGDLVRSSRDRIFDLISPDTKTWIPMEPGMLGLVIPNLHELDTWIRLLTPNGVGDCYCDDVERCD
jgi:hypothetical protein